MTNFAELREAMVDRQIRARGIDDPRLLEAFRTIPRDLFVPESQRDRSYDDGPLPIGADQTISQPYIVALMIAAAGVGEDSHVLEVGSGSGYAAALLGKIARKVVSVERIAALAEQARERIGALGITNVAIELGDGSRGWPSSEPYDAILVAAAGRQIPRGLLEQLRCSGGILVMPVESGGLGQTLVKVTRRGSDEFETADLGGVRFVPLISD